MTAMTAKSLKVGGSGRSCMYHAHIIGTASFMISDGWKRMNPTSSQRCAPLPICPVTATTTSNSTPITYAIGANKRRYCGVASRASASSAATAMAVFAKWCSTMRMFCPEALYTTRTPMHRMIANTPVSAPSKPNARSVRPPMFRVRRVRDGENSSNIIPCSSNSPIVHAAHEAGQQRPDQSADHRSEPPGERRHRVARRAVHPEQHELITRQQSKNGQRLRYDREYPEPEPQIRSPSRHQGQRQGVLSEHDAPGHIEGEPREESQRQASGTRRFDRPVEHHEHQKIRTKRIDWRGQRHDRQCQRDQGR